MNTDDVFRAYNRFTTEHQISGDLVEEVICWTVFLALSAVVAVGAWLILRRKGRGV